MNDELDEIMTGKSLKIPEVNSEVVHRRKTSRAYPGSSLTRTFRNCKASRDGVCAIFYMIVSTSLLGTFDSVFLFVKQYPIKETLT